VHRAGAGGEGLHFQGRTGCPQTGAGTGGVGPRVGPSSLNRDGKWVVGNHGNPVPRSNREGSRSPSSTDTPFYASPERCFYAFRSLPWDRLGSQGRLFLVARPQPRVWGRSRVPLRSGPHATLGGAPAQPNPPGRAPLRRFPTGKRRGRLRGGAGRGGAGGASRGLSPGLPSGAARAVEGTWLAVTSLREPETLAKAKQRSREGSGCGDAGTEAQRRCPRELVHAAATQRSLSPHLSLSRCRGWPV
jgi:hypothetical protein